MLGKGISRVRWWRGDRGMDGGVGGRGGRPSSLWGTAQAEVDGQAIQPPFTFNERAPRLFARLLACLLASCLSADDG